MASARRKHDRKGFRLHLTHSYLWSASESALSLALNRRKGAVLFGLLALIAAAAAVEGFLNFMGRKFIHPWGESEDRKWPKEKLITITSALKYPLVYTNSDYQAFITLFSLRNKLVHGTPEVVKGHWSSELEGISGGVSLDTDWLRAAAPDRVQKLVGLVHDLLAGISSHAGEGSDPFLSQAEGESEPA